MKPDKKIFSLRTLIFAVLVTAAVSSVTLSRYMTTVTGTATASIARFQVDLLAKEETMVFSGTTNEAGTEVRTYDFSVTSDSDVASDYTITVSFDPALPANVVPTIGDIQGSTTDRKSFTFRDNSFTLAMGDGEKNTHTLTLTRDYFEKGQLLSETLSQTAVSISVTAQQTMTTQ